MRQAWESRGCRAGGMTEVHEGMVQYRGDLGKGRERRRIVGGRGRRESMGWDKTGMGMPSPVAIKEKYRICDSHGEAGGGTLKTGRGES